MAILPETGSICYAWDINITETDLISSWTEHRLIFISPSHFPKNILSLKINFDDIDLKYTFQEVRWKWICILKQAKQN